MAQLDGRNIAIFHSSLERLRADATFLNRVDACFMGISPRIAARCEGRELAVLKGKLRPTLNIVTLRVDDEVGMDGYLTSLADTHHPFQILPVLFELWRNSLIESVAESRPRFDGRTCLGRRLRRCRAVAEDPLAPLRPKD